MVTMELVTFTQMPLVTFTQITHNQLLMLRVHQQGSHYVNVLLCASIVSCFNEWLSNFSDIGISIR